MFQDINFFPPFLSWKAFFFLRFELLCLDVELEKGNLLWEGVWEFNYLLGLFFLLG